MSNELNVVDFSSLNLNVEEEDIDETQLVHIANQLINAFSSTGIVCLSNTAVEQDLIERVYKVSREFFEQSVEVKARYRMQDGIQGWKALEGQSFDKDLPGNLIETFCAIIADADSEKWPSNEVDGFREVFVKFYETSARLTQRVLLALAVGLKLDDRQFFNKRHSFMAKNLLAAGIIRSNYYPPTSGLEVKKGQLRLGEHTDFGTVTLLIQDSVGGLEIQNRNTGEWQDVPPIPGTVIVSIADLLQRWTSDRLVSPMHRVRPPRDEVEQKTPRQSVVFFVQPDEDVVVECLDGSDKYKPVSAWEYMFQRLAHVYD